MDEQPFLDANAQQRFHELFVRAFYLGDKYLTPEVENAAAALTPVNDLGRAVLHSFRQRRSGQTGSRFENSDELFAHPTAANLPWLRVFTFLTANALQHKQRFRDALREIQVNVWLDFPLTSEEEIAYRMMVGNCRLYTNDLIGAREMLQLASESANVLNNAILSARVSVDIAVAESHLGDSAGAILRYEEALRVFSTNPSLARESAIVRLNLGVEYARIGRNHDALSQYENVLQQPVVSDNPNLLFAVQLNSALALKALGRMDEAKHQYQEVVAKGDAEAYPLFVVRAMVGLADLELKGGHRDVARSLIEPAIGLAERSNLESAAHHARIVKAEILAQEGQFVPAIEMGLSSFRELVRERDGNNAVTAGSMIVQWAKEIGDFACALDVMEELARIQREANEGEMQRALDLAANRARVERDREIIMTRDQERTKILQTVFPPDIASRLIQGEDRIADMVPNMCVLFADVVDFTHWASSLSPTNVVVMLEELFGQIDSICNTYHCERLKTIGDSYMAISTPLPERNDHIIRMCEAACRILELESHVQLRIGIHCGPVVAGVMRGSRLSYDVWGDTVNVAARMEDAALPGRILCSENVASALAGCEMFALEKREPIDVKGRGVMTTYWLTPRLH